MQVDQQTETGNRSFNSKIVTARLDDELQGQQPLLDQICKKAQLDVTQRSTISKQKNTNDEQQKSSLSPRPQTLSKKRKQGHILIRSNKKQKDSLDEQFTAKEFKKQLLEIQQNVIDVETSLENDQSQENINNSLATMSIRKMLDRFIGVNDCEMATYTPDQLIQFRRIQTQGGMRMSKKGPLNNRGMVSPRKLKKQMPYHDTFNILTKLTQNQYLMDWTDARECKRLSSVIAENHFDNLQSGQTTINTSNQDGFKRQQEGSTKVEGRRASTVQRTHQFFGKSNNPDQNVTNVQKLDAPKGHFHRRGNSTQTTMTAQNLPIQAHLLSVMHSQRLKMNMKKAEQKAKFDIMSSNQFAAGHDKTNYGDSQFQIKNKNDQMLLNQSRQQQLTVNRKNNLSQLEQPLSSNIIKGQNVSKLRFGKAFPAQVSPSNQNQNIKINIQKDAIQRVRKLQNIVRQSPMMINDRERPNTVMIIETYDNKNNPRFTNKMNDARDEVKFLQKNHQLVKIDNIKSQVGKHYRTKSNIDQIDIIKKINIQSVDMKDNYNYFVNGMQTVESPTDKVQTAYLRNASEAKSKRTDYTSPQSPMPSANITARKDEIQCVSEDKYLQEDRNLGLKLGPGRNRIEINEKFLNQTHQQWQDTRPQTREMSKQNFERQVSPFTIQNKGKFDPSLVYKIISQNNTYEQEKHLINLQNQNQDNLNASECESTLKANKGFKLEQIVRLKNNVDNFRQTNVRNENIQKVIALSGTKINYIEAKGKSRLARNSQNQVIGGSTHTFAHDSQKGKNGGARANSYQRKISSSSSHPRDYTHGSQTKELRQNMSLEVGGAQVHEDGGTANPMTLTQQHSTNNGQQQKSCERQSDDLSPDALSVRKMMINMSNLQGQLAILGEGEIESEKVLSRHVSHHAVTMLPSDLEIIKRQSNVEKTQVLDENVQLKSKDMRRFQMKVRRSSLASKNLMKQKGQMHANEYIQVKKMSTSAIAIESTEKKKESPSRQKQQENSILMAITSYAQPVEPNKVTKPKFDINLQINKKPIATAYSSIDQFQTQDRLKSQGQLNSQDDQSSRAISSMTGIVTPTQRGDPITVHSSQYMGIAPLNPQLIHEPIPMSQLPTTNPQHLSLPSLLTHLTTIYISKQLTAQSNFKVSPRATTSQSPVDNNTPIQSHRSNQPITKGKDRQSVEIKEDYKWVEKQLEEVYLLVGRDQRNSGSKDGGIGDMNDSNNAFTPRQIRKKGIDSRRQSKDSRKFNCVIDMIKEMRNSAQNIKIEKDLERTIMSLTIDEKRVVVDMLHDVKQAIEGNDTGRRKASPRLSKSFKYKAIASLANRIIDSEQTLQNVKNVLNHVLSFKEVRAAYEARLSREAALSMAQSACQFGIDRTRICNVLLRTLKIENKKLLMNIKEMNGDVKTKIDLNTGRPVGKNQPEKVAQQFKIKQLTADDVFSSQYRTSSLPCKQRNSRRSPRIKFTNHNNQRQSINQDLKKEGAIYSARNMKPDSVRQHQNSFQQYKNKDQTNGQSTIQDFELLGIKSVMQDREKINPVQHNEEPIDPNLINTIKKELKQEIDGKLLKLNIKDIQDFQKNRQLILMQQKNISDSNLQDDTSDLPTLRKIKDGQTPQIELGTYQLEKNITKEVSEDKLGHGSCKLEVEGMPIQLQQNNCNAQGRISRTQNSQVSTTTKLGSDLVTNTQANQEKEQMNTTGALIQDTSQNSNNDGPQTDMKLQSGDPLLDEQRNESETLDQMNPINLRCPIGVKKNDENRTVSSDAESPESGDKYSLSNARHFFIPAATEFDLGTQSLGPLSANTPYKKGMGYLKSSGEDQTPYMKYPNQLIMSGTTQNDGSPLGLVDKEMRPFIIQKNIIKEQSPEDQKEEPMVLEEDTKQTSGNFQVLKPQSQELQEDSKESNQSPMYLIAATNIGEKIINHSNNGSFQTRNKNDFNRPDSFQGQESKRSNEKRPSLKVNTEQRNQNSSKDNRVELNERSFGQTQHGILKNSNLINAQQTSRKSPRVRMQRGHPNQEQAPLSSLDLTVYGYFTDKQKTEHTFQTNDESFEYQTKTRESKRTATSNMRFGLPSQTKKMMMNDGMNAAAWQKKGQHQYTIFSNNYQLLKQDEVLANNKRSPTPPLPMIVGQNLNSRKQSLIQFVANKRSTTPSIQYEQISSNNRQQNIYQQQNMIDKTPPSISGYHSITQDPPTSYGGHDIEHGIITHARNNEFDSPTLSDIGTMIERGPSIAFQIAPTIQIPRYNVTSHAPQRNNQDIAGYKIGGRNWV